MSVFEGAEYSDLRDMLSSGSGRSQRSQSTPSSANKTISQGDSSMELKVLFDSVKTLLAELLHLKQSYSAVEAALARSKEFYSMKTTILSLKSDLSSLTTTVKSAVVNITLCAEKIESEKSLGVTHLKNELKLLKHDSNAMQETIGTLQYQVASNRASIVRRDKPGSKARAGQNASSPVNSPDLTPGQCLGASGGKDRNGGHSHAEESPGRGLNLIRSDVDSNTRPGGSGGMTNMNIAENVFAPNNPTCNIGPTQDSTGMLNNTDPV